MKVRFRAPNARRGLALCVLLGLAQLPVARLARADTPAAPQTEATPTQAQRDEARQRYNRALELYDEGTHDSYEAALLELQRAYSLAPSYRLLYNVGLVSMQLRDNARAYDAFERYLAEGKDAVPAGRAEEVRGHLARIASRVGTLEINADVAGAEVTVDDMLVGTTPLAKPYRVNVGRRRVAVSMVGKTTQQRVVEVAGADTATLTFRLNEPEQARGGVGAVRLADAPPPSRPIPWPLWGATAALVVGTGVVGAFALDASKTYDASLTTLSTKPVDETSATLSSQRSKVRTLALVTDILGVASIGALAASLYFTLRPPATEKGKMRAVANVTPWPGGAAVTIGVIH